MSKRSIRPQAYIPILSLFNNSQDIVVLVCHVISQGQVIKGSRVFVGKNPSNYVTILASLVAKSTVVVKNLNWTLSDKSINMDLYY